MALEMNELAVDIKDTAAVEVSCGDSVAYARKMVEADVGPVLEFWRGIEGLVLQEEWEDPAAVRRFLRRNAGFSRIVVDAAGQIVGALLCGHDGCRGYLYNLAVHKDYRHQGWANVLVRSSLQALRAEGIRYCHTYIHGSDLLRSMSFLSLTQGRLRTDIPLLTLTLLPERPGSTR